MSELTFEPNAGKHAGHIVAIENKYLDQMGLKEGFTPYSPWISEQLRSTANGAVQIRRRRELDAKGSVIPVMQFLPYILVRQKMANGQWGIFVYRRTKLIGEGRLVGNASIGVGGHVDGVDVRWNLDNAEGESMFDFEASMRANMLREVMEELVFLPRGEGGSEFEQLIVTERVQATVNYAVATARPAGYLFDHSDDVGKYHLGLVYVMDIPADLLVTTRSKLQSNGEFCPELEAVGFLTVDQLQISHLPWESWSKLTFNSEAV